MAEADETDRAVIAGKMRSCRLVLSAKRVD